MCGVAGVVRRQGQGPVADPGGLAELLGATLAHRGPDGGGSWCSSAGDALLVHRRLAIIDPGPAGAQPMATADGRHRIVFNGEIYNYRELGRELESRGERFGTSSDTEVLLRLLVRDGPSALARLRGMFALAWWDGTERALLLARDRFGIKPLYIAAAPHQIAFASELGTLRRARLIDGQLSSSGILAFLSWGSVPPPLTWQRGAEMLLPGAWRIWRQDGGESRGVFASTRDVYLSDRRRAVSEDAFKERVRHAVRDSVRAHLTADVPVGVFLSGGVDSSAIVSVASSIAATPLQTFTVGFEHESSEAARARRVATMFATRHHELNVDASEVASDLPRILAHLDQPSIDGVNTYYVARAVARTGIKAVLSGTGGDELFGGYPSFARLPRAVGLKRAMSPLWPMAAWAETVLPERLRARWRHFATTNGGFVDAYRVQRGFLMPHEMQTFAGPALCDPSVWREACDELTEIEHSLFASSGDEQPQAAVARLESCVYLSSQLLRDIDVMAMAHGLEVRVPYVDHELLATVWPDLGFHPALLRSKRLLHETLDRPLPELIVRQPKQGFTLPFATWIGGDLAPAVREGMQRLSDAGWVGRDTPERVWRAWNAGAAHWSRPWGLAVLGHFVSGHARNESRRSLGLA